MKNIRRITNHYNLLQGTLTMGRIIFSFSVIICITLLESCSDSQVYKFNNHEIACRMENKRIGVLVDETSDKAISLLDCANVGVMDVVQIFDQVNKRATIIFEQNHQTVVLVENAEDKDGKNWTASLLFEGELFSCHKGKALQWEFADKSGVMHYVHLKDIPGGHLVDTNPDVK